MEYKCDIIYYGEKKCVLLPSDYNDLMNKLSNMLQIPQELMHTIKLSYEINSDDGKILIKSIDDYQDFIFKLASKETKELLIEISEDPVELDKKDEENKIEENIEEKIEEKIDQKIDWKENNINNEDNNIINEEKEKENKKEPENNNIKEDENNIMNENIKEDNLDIKEVIIKEEHEDKIEEEMKKIKLPKKEIIFDAECCICKKANIPTIVYYCKKCQFFLCDECEEKIGANHNHPFYKLTTKEQYNDALNIKEENPNEQKINYQDSKIGQVYNGISQKIGGAFNSFLNFFKKDDDSNKNNIKEPVFNNANLIQMAKAQYKLSQFTDREIENSIIQNKGNIDQAVVNLFSNKK